MAFPKAAVSDEPSMPCHAGAKLTQEVPHDVRVRRSNHANPSSPIATTCHGEGGRGGVRTTHPCTSLCTQKSPSSLPPLASRLPTREQEHFDREMRQIDAEVERQVIGNRRSLGWTRGLWRQTRASSLTGEGSLTLRTLSVPRFLMLERNTVKSRAG